MPTTTEVIDGVLRIPGYCSCGLEMKATMPSMKGLYCPNCDRVQDQETRCPECGAVPVGKCKHEPGKRVATDRDYAFMKVWRQRMLKLYPGQSLR